MFGGGGYFVYCLGVLLWMLGDEFYVLGDFIIGVWLFVDGLGNFVDYWCSMMGFIEDFVDWYFCLVGEWYFFVDLVYVGFYVVDCLFCVGVDVFDYCGDFLGWLGGLCC